MRALLIAAPSSGTGKTSVTLGLVNALRRRGLAVQCFKTGPDYLDPTHLARASARSCFNLDGWMMGADYVRSSFALHAANADVALIEGAMGLFDGASPASIDGSSADIARTLDVPVALIVDAHGAAASVAATVAGFASFEPGVHIATVIANRCGSARHAAWIADALAARSLPPLAGWLSRDALPTLASRHLGLVTASDATLSDDMLNALGDAVAASIDLDALIAHAAPIAVSVEGRSPHREPCTRIGIARDEAFHFYYADNLAALAAAGATLVPFSPVHDATLPADLDALYIGGGYPEQHAATLAANTSMLTALRDFAASRRVVYAECGGLMLLGTGIELLDGSRHAMAGVLPCSTRMLARRKALGYVEATALHDDTPLAPKDATLRGHEFHYSEMIEPITAPAYSVRTRHATAPVHEGVHIGNVTATYVHAHFASVADAAARFVDACRARCIA